MRAVSVYASDVWPAFGGAVMLTPEALEGQSLGKYRVQQKVGEGGMACVYRAVQVDFESPVAIKVLFPEHARKELVRKRFAREARLQFRLRHPNIVRVLEMIDEVGLVGMVMDWVDGIDLEQHLRRLGRPLTNQEILELFVPILDAVGYAHQHQIVHRDLKPSNIVLEQSGKRLVPKVMDFGIAKSVEDEQVTSTGVFLGTPAFLAPEQVQDARKVDHRVDIYALGVCLFRAAAGQLPFSQGDFMSVVAAHLMNKPPMLSEFYARVDPRLEPIVQKALEKNPALRFSSCEAFAEALQSALSNSAPLSSPRVSSQRSPAFEPPETLQTFPPTVPSMLGVSSLPSADSWDIPTVGAAIYNSAEHPVTLRQDVSALQRADAGASPVHLAAVSGQTDLHSSDITAPSAKNRFGRRSRRIWRSIAGLLLGIFLALFFSFSFLWIFPDEPRPSRTRARKAQDADSVFYSRNPPAPNEPRSGFVKHPEQVAKPSAQSPVSATSPRSVSREPSAQRSANRTRTEPSSAKAIVPSVRPALPDRVAEQDASDVPNDQPNVSRTTTPRRRTSSVPISSEQFSKKDLLSCRTCLKMYFRRSVEDTVGLGLPGDFAPLARCTKNGLYQLARQCVNSCRADYRVLCSSYVRVLDSELRALRYKSQRGVCRDYCSYRDVMSNLRRTYRFVEKLRYRDCFVVEKRAK